MVFSDLTFIYIFLPLFLIVYYITPQKSKNTTLLLGSIIFYTMGSWEHPHYIGLIILSIIVNYFIANLIEKKQKKILLILGLVYNLSWLFIFKYSDFIFTTINPNFNTLNLVLPVGISFYTFQAISYLIDIYRKKFHAEKSIIKFGTYIIMFPQLVAGPIVTYSLIKEQLSERKHSLKQISEGLKYFILGLGFKILLANMLGILWNDILVIGIESISTPLAWLGIISYSLQIYFDFCGYSLMAIGLGKLLGFDIPINFETPYLSKSMSEFFRRWHITLGKWFKEYVYIPLGGNKRGIFRTILNLGIVWLLTGLWHGANWNFVLWGIFIFIIITIEKIFLQKKLDNHPIIAHIYLIVLIPLMWTIFAITDINDLVTMFSRLFIFNSGIPSINFLNYLFNYGILIILGIICATKIPYKYLLHKDLNFITIVVFILIFIASIYCLYQGLNNPFLYFRF